MPPRRRMPQRRPGQPRRTPDQARAAQASRAAEMALAEKRRQVQRMQAARSRLRTKGSLPRDIYERQRKSWAGIPVIGSLIELLRHFFYRQDSARVAKRISHRQMLKGPTARAKGRIMVELEMKKHGYNPARSRRAQTRGRKTA